MAKVGNRDNNQTMTSEVLKNILVIGSGGREHALGWKLSQSAQTRRLFFAPGNGGTSSLGENIDLGGEETNQLARWALESKIDLTVVGPEAPLADGIVDLFTKKGLRIFGPSRSAARLETSKAWANRFMRRHNIPCPSFQIFDSADSAKQFIMSSPWPELVVKASGLAAGKGVLLPESVEEAVSAVDQIMVAKKFGSAGDQVVIQERMFGPEVSVLAFTDGKTAVPLLPAQDYKRAFDGDQGPNTGGMGAYVPAQFMTAKLLQTVQERILQPTIDGMREEGHPYKGVLYAGLMITDNGPQVLEFNVRFGDPETQPQMKMLESDLVPILLACVEGGLRKQQVVFRTGAAACVVLASEGYPGSYEKGKAIHGLDQIEDSRIQLFHSGTAVKNGQVVTDGGRVLGVTCDGESLETALNTAYSSITVGGVYFNNMHYRQDIGFSPPTRLTPLTFKSFTLSTLQRLGHPLYLLLYRAVKLLEGGYPQPHRIEIAPRVPDARAQIRKKKLENPGLTGKITDVSLVDVFTLDKRFDDRQLESIASMLADPITQTVSFDRQSTLYQPGKGFDWAIEVGFLPGVTDNVGATARESIEDLLQVRFQDNEGVYSSQITFVSGELSEADARKIAADLHNPIIQRVQIKDYQQFMEREGMNVVVPKVKLEAETAVDTVDLNVDDEELLQIGKEGIKNTEGTSRGPLALNLIYMKAIRGYFNQQGRDPTDVELESIAQTWSEHCKHTIFADPMDEVKDGLFKTYIKGATEEIRKRKGKNDFCVSVFKDNSGAILFDDNYLLTDKLETHNSPSALDPFGGAITGIVGVNRDTIGFGLGAKPIINRYGFCFANPKDSSKLYKGANFTQEMLSAERIMNGVVEGVNVGGNCSGIPTTQGFLFFDQRYRGKPLVFVGTVGLIPRKIGPVAAHQKKAQPGDYIVMIGGRVGLDGIHGATFSSEVMDAGSPAGAVQIGDPITQKKLSDAVVKEARDLGLFNSITDNGAGGLSCSVAEMAEECGGCLVQLDKVPLKYPGMAPWQTWISESQERMTLSVSKSNWKQLFNLMNRRGVEATIIGEFTNSGRCIVEYNEQTVMDVEMDFLHHGLPTRLIKTSYTKPNLKEPSILQPNNLTDTLHTMLKRPNIASFEFISQQYDHEVQGSSVIKPLQGRGRVNGDATVTKPVLNSPKGVVISHGLYPNYSDIDTYHMAACAIDTAIRNAVCVGANLDSLALLDNFCWCSSDEPERLGQLKRAAKACYDYAVSYGTPFISGKDSMFNDFKGFDETGQAIKISVPPTLLISSIGVMNDASRAISLDAKFPGDLVYVLGETYDELGGSEYYRWCAQRSKKDDYIGNSVPQVNASRNQKLYRALAKAIDQGLVASAQSVGRGGLAVALAKTAIGGRLGLDISLKNLAGFSSRNDFTLFSETQGRVVVTVSPDNQDQFEKIIGANSFGLLGKVAAVSEFRVTDKSGKVIIATPISVILRSYKTTFGDY